MMPAIARTSPGLVAVMVGIPTSSAAFLLVRGRSPSSAGSFANNMNGKTLARVLALTGSGHWAEVSRFDVAIGSILTPDTHEPN